MTREKPDLEQLLNMLIQRGWKPFNKWWLNLIKLSGVHQWWLLLHKPSTRVAANYSLRDLTSRESNLWQFVCENELYPPYIQHRWFRDLPTNWLQIHDYRYWVIESSLEDESELEQFLLDSIIINEQA